MSMTRQKGLLITDFDDTAVQTTIWAGKKSDDHLFASAAPLYEVKFGRKLSRESFDATAGAMRMEFGSLTQAYQFLLGMNNQWAWQLRKDDARRFARDVLDNTEPDYETDAYLAELIAMGYRPLICTNNVRDAVREVIDGLFWGRHFGNEHIIDIETLNNITKSSGLWLLYVREHFPEYWDEGVDRRYMLEDRVRNFFLADRVGVKRGFVHKGIQPLVHQADFHVPDFNAALHTVYTQSAA